jgi:hypothetical protein
MDHVYELALHKMAAFLSIILRTLCFKVLGFDIHINQNMDLYFK